MLYTFHVVCQIIRFDFMHRETKSGSLNYLRCSFCNILTKTLGRYSVWKWQTDNVWIMIFFFLYCEFCLKTHFRLAKIRAQLCCRSKMALTLFYHSWNSKDSPLQSLKWPDMGFTNNQAHLHLEKNSKREQRDEESVVPSLFYYLVSLWRNPQIASTDPGFTVACHPGNL